MRWVDWGVVAAVLVANLSLIVADSVVSRGGLIALCGVMSALLVGEIVRRNQAHALLLKATGIAAKEVVGSPVGAVIHWVERKQELLAQQGLLQAAELARAQDVLDAVPVGIVVATPGGQIIRTNTAAGTLFTDLQRQDSTLSVQANIRHAEVIRLFERIVGGAHVRPSDVSTLTAPERILRVSGSAMVQSSNDRQVVLVVEDVTDRRRAERVRREFIGNVSHELRTPITAIMATSELLLEDDLSPEDRRRFVQVVSRHSERLHTLIRDLLVLSQLDHPAARRSLVREAVVIHEVLDTAMRSSFERAASRGVVVSTAVAPEVAPVFAMHRALIIHALTNLLDNAINHSSPQARVELLVSMRGESLCFAVRDFGVGIDPEHLPRLFERFYRVDKGRSRTEGGSGIGLAIVKHVAVVHGGTVDVASEVGRGALFTIILPPPGGQGLLRKEARDEKRSAGTLGNHDALDGDCDSAGCA